MIVRVDGVGEAAQKMTSVCLLCPAPLFTDYGD